MPQPVAALARQLDADLLRAEAAAQNIANAQTPGFRAARLAFGPKGAELRPDLRTPGGLDSTGQALDVAVIGPGWLVVETPEGTRYTRTGELRRLSDGTLATVAGHPVLGHDGPIRIADAPVVIDAQGTLTQDGVARGRLRVVTLPDLAAVLLAGPGLFAFDGEVTDARDARVVQGALERANVDVTDEMVRLMSAARHAESVQRALGAYEQALATALTELGRNR